MISRNGVVGPAGYPAPTTSKVLWAVHACGKRPVPKHVDRAGLAVVDAKITALARCPGGQRGDQLACGERADQLRPPTTRGPGPG